MKVQMYKAVDVLDGKVSMFAVYGKIMAVSLYSGSCDSWLSSISFGQIYEYPILKADHERMINPVLLWEK